MAGLWNAKKMMGRGYNLGIPLKSGMHRCNTRSYVEAIVVLIALIFFKKNNRDDVFVPIRPSAGTVNIRRELGAMYIF